MNHSKKRIFYLLQLLDSASIWWTAPCWYFVTSHWSANEFMIFAIHGSALTSIKSKKSLFLEKAQFFKNVSVLENITRVIIYSTIFTPEFHYKTDNQNPSPISLTETNINIFCTVIQLSYDRLLHCRDLIDKKYVSSYSSRDHLHNIFSNDGICTSTKSWAPCTEFDIINIFSLHAIPPDFTGIFIIPRIISSTS